ncbi:hypothetical protein YC2023_119075 [Brassica napus]
MRRRMKQRGRVWRGQQGTEIDVAFCSMDPDAGNSLARRCQRLLSLSMAVQADVGVILKSVGSCFSLAVHLRSSQLQ